MVADCGGGAAYDGWALNARAVSGIGPVAEVEHRAWLFGLEVVIAGNGGERTQEHVAGVGHDGGAARRDFVAGLELIEFAERVVDGERVAEFLDVSDEGRGKVGLVEFSLAVCSVFGAEARVRIRDGHAATASAGGAMLTMERDRIGIGDGCFRLRVHESSFRS